MDKNNLDLDPTNLYREFDTFKDFDSSLTVEQALDLQCVCFAKDMADKIGIKTELMRKHYELHGPKKTGIVKFMGSWLVRIPVFKTYYNNYLKEGTAYTVEELPEVSNLVELLALQGVYKLKAVMDTHLFPFPEHRIAVYIKNETERLEKNGETLNPRQTYGVWKGMAENVYLVDMPIFSKWLNSLWANSTF